jgi:D-alanyl-D-alanine carboxypeptidase/D-alanyl-D-alanine-endopeptidase (penicillin-binding protein 4)
MKDGSGLSQLNRVTPKLVAQLMAKVATSEEYLGNMEGMLPVAGRTGTLAGRFTGYNAVARGFVKAKSGYIPGLYSLAGIIDSKDGGRIAFAIFARSGDGKSVGYLARPALDSVAAKFYRCGLGLTL